jgi:hypothetical protein
MPAVKLTDAQRCLLRVIDDLGSTRDSVDWTAVDVEYFRRRPLPDVKRDYTPTARIVANALRRRGLIYEHGGPELTQAGSDELMTGRLDWLPDGRES